MNASSISRKLRSAGLRPLPSGTERKRDGISVTHGTLRGTVLVRVSTDSDIVAGRLTAEVLDVLRPHYTVEMRVEDRGFRLMIVSEAKKTCSCGEPEDGGDFGWFDHADGHTYCNSCGSKVEV